MRLLGRFDVPFESSDRVVFPAEIDCFFSKELLHHLNGFLKVPNAGSRAGKWHPHLLKLSGRDASSQTKFKAAVGQQVERGGFSGEEHRMTIPITEHIAANAQRGGCRGRDR